MNLLDRWIPESVRVKRGKLVFDYNSTRYANSTSTRMGKNKFEPLMSLIDGHPVFSVYSVSGDHTGEVLKAIKGLNGVGTDPKDYRHFVLRTAIFLSGRVLWNRGIDMIVYPHSSSAFLQNVVATLGKRYTTQVIDNSFEKSLGLRIVDDPRITPDIRHRLEQFIASAKESGKVSIKTLKPMYRKFIAGFMDYTGPDVTGKKICVMDDILTSGTSMMEMFRNLTGAQSIIGATIFKVQ